MDGQTFQTKTISGGGKKPEWNDKTTFNIKNTAGEISCTVYDEDTISNDLNCAGKIGLTKICVVGGTDMWHDLAHEGAVRGRIHLATVWSPAE